jgi:hypothetical protein
MILSDRILCIRVALILGLLTIAIVMTSFGATGAICAILVVCLLGIMDEKLAARQSTAARHEAGR